MTGFTFFSIVRSNDFSTLIELPSVTLIWNCIVAESILVGAVPETLPSNNI